MEWEMGPDEDGGTIIMKPDGDEGVHVRFETHAVEERRRERTDVKVGG